MDSEWLQEMKGNVVGPKQIELVILIRELKKIGKNE